MGKEGLPHIESPIHIKGEEGRKPTTGKTAGMASLAACSTGSGVSRWSAQSCGPRRQSWRRMALASPGQVGSVLLCRRDRRHGKPGGLLHGQRRLQVERAVLRATPPVLAAEGVGKPRTGWVCVALPARPPAWQAWRLAPRAAASPGGARSLAGYATSLGGGWRWQAPDRLGLCCSAGATAGMASLAACSTGCGHAGPPLQTSRSLQTSRLG